MKSPVAMNEMIRQHRLLVADLIAADNQVSLLRDQIRAVETVMTLMGYEGDMPAYPVRRPTFPIFARINNRDHALNAFYAAIFSIE